MGEITPALDPPISLAHFATFFGADVPVIVHFTHESDGHPENRPLLISSMQRNKYPNPHIIRGILEIDLNRPGQDAGDMAVNVDVVLEVWSYPKTLVYSAVMYEPVYWSFVENLPKRVIFRCNETTYIKSGHMVNIAELSKENRWIPVEKPFDKYPNHEYPKHYDCAEIISTP